ncbi:MAG: hypothetical protein AAFR38_05395 [Planctomycetota bacterium]
MHASVRFVVAIVAMVSSAAHAAAGSQPVRPPAGPVADTGRFGPRTEINAANTPGDNDSVFRIVSPGSYYLAQNISVPAGFAGIEISSSDVTIDLGGFRIAGFFGEGGVGIRVASQQVQIFTNIAIRNGIIRQCNRGIEVGNFGVSGIEAHNVLISGIKMDLVRSGVFARRAVIEGCNVRAREIGYSLIESMINGSTAVLYDSGATSVAFDLAQSSANDCTAASEDNASGSVGFELTTSRVGSSQAAGVPIPFRLQFTSLATSCYGIPAAGNSVSADSDVFDSNFGGMTP